MKVLHWVKTFSVFPTERIFFALFLSHFSSSSSEVLEVLEVGDPTQEVAVVVLVVVGEGWGGGSGFERHPPTQPYNILFAATVTQNKCTLRYYATQRSAER